MAITVDPVVMLKADGVLVGAFLCLFVDIQLAAEIEGKSELIAGDVLANRLEVVERLFLKCAQRRVVISTVETTCAGRSRAPISNIAGMQFYLRA
jgi:hypothetical protein